jgi:hypothetical protein
VHGYFCPVLFTQGSAITGVVMVSMGQYYEFEVARPATRLFQLFLKVGALGRIAGINQDISEAGFNQIAINATEIDDFNLLRHSFLLTGRLEIRNSVSKVYHMGSSIFLRESELARKIADENNRRRKGAFLENRLLTMNITSLKISPDNERRNV